MVTSLEPTADPTQAEPVYQLPSDFYGPFDDMNFGSLGGAGLPEPVSGGFGISNYNPEWPLANNLDSLPVYPPPDFDYGATQTPFMNIAQQRQWTSDSQFSTSNPASNPALNTPLSTLRPPPFFHTTGYTNPSNLIGPVQQNQFLNAALSVFTPQVVGEVL